MTLLPYQNDDVVQWRGQLALVREVRGDRLVLETDDGSLHITTQDRLREHQQPRRGAA